MIRTDVSKIVPTQRNLTIYNLEDTKDVSENTGAYLLKNGDLYYILDGHHRIANIILQGDEIIRAYVFSNE